MGRIKDLNLYPPDSLLKGDESLIGSNTDLGGVTQNYYIRDIQGYVLQDFPDFFRGNATIAANVITILEGAYWRIDGYSYRSETDYSFTIPYAGAGLRRKDIIVATDSWGFERIAGTATSGIPIAPNVPSARVLAFTLDVTATTVTFQGFVEGQDNFVRVKPMLFDNSFSGDLVAQVVNSFNNGSLFENYQITITDTETYIIKAFPIFLSAEVGNILPVYKFSLVNLGKNLEGEYYGYGGIPISAGNLELIYSSPANVQDIEDLFNTQTVDLGWDITGTDISSFINVLATPIELQDSSVGYVLIKVVNGGNQETYLFTGAGGTYGLGQDQTTPDQFQLVDAESQPITRTSQLVNDGNDGTDFFIESEDLEEGMQEVKDYTDDAIDSLTTTVIPEGTNWYFTFSRVLGTLLTPINFAITGDILATDSIINAFAKIRNSLASLVSDVTGLTTQVANIPKRRYTVTYRFAGGTAGQYNGLSFFNAAPTYSSSTSQTTMAAIDVNFLAGNIFVTPAPCKLVYAGEISNIGASTFHNLGIMARLRGITGTYTNKMVILETTVSSQTLTLDVTTSPVIPKNYSITPFRGVSTGSGGDTTLIFEEI